MRDDCPPFRISLHRAWCSAAMIRNFGDRLPPFRCGRNFFDWAPNQIDHVGWHPLNMLAVRVAGEHTETIL